MRRYSFPPLQVRIIFISYPCSSRPTWDRIFTSTSSQCRLLLCLVDRLYKLTRAAIALAVIETIVNLFRSCLDIAFGHVAYNYGHREEIHGSATIADECSRVLSADDISSPRHEVAMKQPSTNPVFCDWLRSILTR